MVILRLASGVASAINQLVSGAIDFVEVLESCSNPITGLTDFLSPPNRLSRVGVVRDCQVIKFVPSPSCQV